MKPSQEPEPKIPLNPVTRRRGNKKDRRQQNHQMKSLLKGQSVDLAALEDAILDDDSADN